MNSQSPFEQTPEQRPLIVRSIRPCVTNRLVALVSIFILAPVLCCAIKEIKLKARRPNSPWPNGPRRGYFQMVAAWGTRTDDVART